MKLDLNSDSILMSVSVDDVIVEIDTLENMGLLIERSETRKKKIYKYSGKFLRFEFQCTADGNTFLAELKIPENFKKSKQQFLTLCYLHEELIITRENSKVSDSEVSQLVLGGCVNFLSGLRSTDIYVGTSGGKFSAISPTAGYYILAEPRIFIFKRLKRYWSLDEALAQGDFSPLTLDEIIDGKYG